MKIVRNLNGVTIDITTDREVYLLHSFISFSLSTSPSKSGNEIPKKLERELRQLHFNVSPD